MVECPVRWGQPFERSPSSKARTRSASALQPVVSGRSIPAPYRSGYFTHAPGRNRVMFSRPMRNRCRAEKDRYRAVGGFHFDVDLGAAAHDVDFVVVVILASWLSA